MQGKSCLIKLGIGCGTMVLLFILLGVAATLAIKLDQPTSSDLSELTLTDTFEGNAEPSPRLQGLPDAPIPGKPLRLHIDAAFTKINFKRGEQSGHILVESHYDQANFDLSTRVEEAEDAVEYHLDFSSKHNALALLYSFAHERGSGFGENELTIILPADHPIFFDTRTRYCEAEYELGGLAVAGIEVEHRMGSMKMSMAKANPIPMESFKLNYKMGGVHCDNFENYKFEEAAVTGSMGEMRLKASGPLAEDAEVLLDVSFGEIRIVAPTHSNIKNTIRTRLAERRYRHEQPKPEWPTLTLKGKVSLGELRVVQEGHVDWIRSRAFELTNQGKLDEVIVSYREFNERKPGALRPGDLNNLGYHFMHSGKSKEAIAVLTLNVELFPDYANGYDSLGEAYYQDRQLEVALANYMKANEMDRTRHAEDMIADLEAMLARRQMQTSDEIEMDHEDN